MTKRLPLAVTFALMTVGVFAAGAHASCVLVTPAEKRARADVILNGVALEGPTSTGIQRFRVLRYTKGFGPAVVRVRTGNMHRPDGTGSITSVSLVVRRGEKWRIFGRGSARRVVSSNVCDGSKRL